MKKKNTTKIALIFLFLGFYFSSMIFLALKKSGVNLGILGIIPFFLLAMLMNFVNRRLKEKGEVPTHGTVLITIFLLLIPIINLFVLYDIIKDKKEE